MSESKQCRECGGTFLYTTYDQLCLNCSQKNEQEFQMIKAFLKQRPRASAALIATELGINISSIHRFIEQGRLEIIEK